MNGVRLDKWLWAARFFKTRTLATRACDLNRVEVQGSPAKPSRELRVGTMVRVRTESNEIELEVLELSEVRGPASAAQALYQETDASKRRRTELAEQRRLMPSFQVLNEGKPSKRDRRKYEQVRKRG